VAHRRKEREGLACRWRWRWSNKQNARRWAEESESFGGDAARVSPSAHHEEINPQVSGSSIAIQSQISVSQTAEVKLRTDQVC